MNFLNFKLGILNIGQNFFDIIQDNLLWFVAALLVFGIAVAFMKRNYIAIFTVVLVGGLALFIVDDPMRVADWGDAIGGALTR